MEQRPLPYFLVLGPYDYESLHLSRTLHYTSTIFQFLNFLIMKNSKNVSGGPMVKNLPCDAGDAGSTPGLGRFQKPWGNEALVPQLLKPGRSKVFALQEEKPAQHNEE